MHILVFLNDDSASLRVAARLSRCLSARCTCVDSREAMQAALAAQPFDAAILALPPAVGGSEIPTLDDLLAARLPVLVQTSEYGALCKSLYARKPIMDYVVGEDEEAERQMVEVLRRFQRNRHTRALVVDDSAAYRAQLSFLLHTQGLEVLTAEDGVKALALLEQHPVSLMLTDYQMPNMDGLALTRAVRRMFGKQELAVLVLTASEESQATDFIKSGANDFLYKPFTREELTCRVNQNLDLIYLLADTQDMADRDFLTRLYNRRYFMGRIAERFSKGMAVRQPMAVVMLDIDHFKRINDTYGHDAGDDAIRSLARLLADAVDEVGAVVARMGGEEFAIWLPMAGAAVGEWLESVRVRVAQTPVETASGELWQTVSIGWCDNSSRHHDALASALTAADAALYAAKAGGRNRVCQALDEVCQQPVAMS